MSVFFPIVHIKLRSFKAIPELDTDWIHPWIGLDWVSQLVDCVGLDLTKRTHVQLCAVLSSVEDRLMKQIRRSCKMPFRTSTVMTLSLLGSKEIISQEMFG